VRDRHQPNHEANKQHTAENQSLSKIEHNPVSAPEKQGIGNREKGTENRPSFPQFVHHSNKHPADLVGKVLSLLS
jgi:hypothetical protein